MNNQITIKTERDVETQLGIKVEKACTSHSVADGIHQVNGTDSPVSTSSNTQTELCVDEKMKLIENILTLKSANQTLVQKLNVADTKMKASKKKLEEKIEELTSQLNEMKQQMTNATQANEKYVSDLKRENLLLAAQNKQLKTGLHQAENAHESNGVSDDDFYEVETLLSHKEIRETHYLVQWKGFDESQNSWERESNLHCPGILKKYKKINKIK